ncbi:MULTISPECIES: nucleoside deaminase [unclassified Paenibacillus]|uniref:nucleoside deaminase n=1 Tax=unclassified Paenibacillus TaxID=185978 RepID=UPI00104C0EDA|nr:MULTISPECIES: nucleoside deaminase [unclassified Paenibacillus]NIK68274.1 tRNA(Arg) A34 adenosine deaminase TadA [Paenibacillus sp. BK720]TCM99511.1 tRNA(Arg) A34 adenosine deaminase TadA [Paenibacillus sp. BK033]
MTQDEIFMREAIYLSKLAVEHGNEPFGAVLVKNGEIVYSNENRIYSATDPTFHAEAGLLRRFCAETQITDLREYTMYSSCEPCFMCSGAMVWTQLGRLVYAASDMDLCGLLNEKGSRCSEIVFGHSHHKPEVLGGVLREESLSVLAGYFSQHDKG